MHIEKYYSPSIPGDESLHVASTILVHMTGVYPPAIGVEKFDGNDIIFIIGIISGLVEAGAFDLG